MCRGKLRSRVLTPNAGSVKNYMKRLDNRISRRDASLCRRAGFSIDRTACIDGRDKRLRPPGRPARSQSTARVSGTDTSFPRPRPSSEKRRVRLKVMQNCLDRQYRVARYVPERTPPHCGCPKHERLENCMRLFVMMCLPLLPVC